MIKKAILVGIAAMLAMAFSASSAMAWTNPDEYTFDGSLTSTLQLGMSPNPSLTCDVSFDADLFSGSSNLGSVTTASTFPCVSSDPNCAVAVDATPNLPWGVSGGSGAAEVGGVLFNAVYSGQNCSLGPLTLEVSGDVTGAVDYPSGSCGASEQQTRLSFNDAPGLKVTDSNNPNVINTQVTLSDEVSTVCLADTDNPELE